MSDLSEADTRAKAELRLAALIKESRQAANKAEAVENAVFDLKAVNPHRKADVDTRSPSDLLDLIEAKGTEIASVLTALRAAPQAFGDRSI